MKVCVMQGIRLMLLWIQVWLCPFFVIVIQ